MLNRGATLADFQSAGKPLAKELLNVIEIWGAIKSAQSRISRLDIPSRPAPLDLFSFLKKRQNLIAISGDELESFTKARGIILKTTVTVDRKVFRLPVWSLSPAKLRFPYNSKCYRSIITILRRSFILSHSPVVFSSLEHQHIADFSDGWARGLSSVIEQERMFPRCIVPSNWHHWNIPPTFKNWQLNFPLKTVILSFLVSLFRPIFTQVDEFTRMPSCRIVLPSISILPFPSPSRSIHLGDVSEAKLRAILY